MSDTDLEFMLVFCKCGHVRAVHEGLKGPASYWGIGRCNECAGCSGYRPTNKKLVAYTYKGETKSKWLFNWKGFLGI